MIIPVAIAYVGVLFAVAYFGDKRADAGQSVIANPYIYALSLGVYATAWTFYGSVGRAASDGVGFLPIYIGPTLMMALVAGRAQDHPHQPRRTASTSLADFVSSRYGKSALLARPGHDHRGGRHRSLHRAPAEGDLRQLHDPRHASRRRAVGAGGRHLVRARHGILGRGAARGVRDPGRHRHLDASERHEGMVAAIAFESIVKLVAFLAVGAFVTYGMYGGMGDLFARARGGTSAAAHPVRAAVGRIRRLCQLGVAHAAFDARDPLPAAAVPDRGGRERQRAASARRCGCSRSTCSR
ncbi:MAG: hypothetical protein U1F54_15490 [Burkholderiales bacterium]